MTDSKVMKQEGSEGGQTKTMNKEDTEGKKSAEFKDELEMGSDRDV